MSCWFVGFLWVALWIRSAVASAMATLATDKQKLIALGMMMICMTSVGQCHGIHTLSSTINGIWHLHWDHPIWVHVYPSQWIDCHNFIRMCGTNKVSSFLTSMVSAATALSGRMGHCNNSNSSSSSLCLLWVMHGLPPMHGESIYGNTNGCTRQQLHWQCHDTSTLVLFAIAAFSIITMTAATSAVLTGWMFNLNFEMDKAGAVNLLYDHNRP